MEQEIIEQGRAFAMMHGDIMKHIDTYAAEFREIVESFKKKFGRPPMAEDLLWIASEHAGRDITEEP